MVKHLHMAIGSTIRLTGLQAAQEIEELARQHPINVAWQRIIIILKLKTGLDSQKTITKVRQISRLTDPTAQR